MADFWQKGVELNLKGKQLTEYVKSQERIRERELEEKRLEKEIELEQKRLEIEQQRQEIEEQRRRE
ncbi:hypothetical protein, partial [Acinetobacter baumannii]|uniref:hypothetical protein n=1 Tax=Acinetobacter baumannii TaxID=470 RepID=UPI00339B3D97